METTIPLDETVRQAAGAGRMAICWLTPGAAEPYRLIDESRTTVGRGSY